jgi:hypothetical protein
LSIARRPLLDLPIAVSGGAPMPSATSSSPGGSAAGGPTTTADDHAVTMRHPSESATNGPDPDFDLSSTFDVPAFLRRQEG